MLVLTRRAGERLIISVPGIEPITVAVTGAVGQVRIGVDAPKDVGIDREEIYLKKLQGVQA